MQNDSASDTASEQAISQQDEEDSQEDEEDEKPHLPKVRCPTVHHFPLLSSRLRLCLPACHAHACPAKRNTVARNMTSTRGWVDCGFTGDLPGDQRFFVVLGDARADGRRSCTGVGHPPLAVAACNSSSVAGHVRR